MSEHDLSFTYEPPGENSVPEWCPGTPRDTRVAIYWNPSIGCTAEQVERETSLTKPPGIPWNNINIAEIRVESRVAFEVLRRLVPADTKVLCRICPPVPLERPSMPPEIRRSVTIFTDGLRIETALAAGITESLREECLPLIVGECDEWLLSATAVAVFCHRAASTVDHLRGAIENGCSILSSDAGAAEEYLSKFALPGKWHVARSWKSTEWREMLRELLGQPNRVTQTSVVDLTPYVKPWGSK